MRVEYEAQTPLIQITMPRYCCRGFLPSSLDTYAFTRRTAPFLEKRNENRCYENAREKKRVKTKIYAYLDHRVGGEPGAHTWSRLPPSGSLHSNGERSSGIPQALPARQRPGTRGHHVDIRMLMCRPASAAPPAPRAFGLPNCQPAAPGLAPVEPRGFWAKAWSPQSRR